MKGDLHSVSWPASQLGDAIDALARASGICPRTPLSNPPDSIANSSPGAPALKQWLETTAVAAGLELQEAESRLSDLERDLTVAGPALLQITTDGRPCFLSILRGRRHVVPVIAPDLRVHWIRCDAIRGALCSALECPVLQETNELLTRVGVGMRRRQRTAKAIVRELLSARPIGGWWLLQLPPQAPFMARVISSRLPLQLLVLAGAHVLEYLLWISSWYIIGEAALQGRVDRGWLTAWALVLITMVPFKALATWWEGRVAIGTGSLFKQHLLYGALRLDPSEVRAEGAGQLLGRVIESQAVESLGLTGGFLALVTFIELGVAVLVLGLGAGGLWQVLLLTAWVFVTLATTWVYVRHYKGWTVWRVQMTNDLVERMVGYRTLLVQQKPGKWHREEDESLARYLSMSEKVDRAAALLMVLVPRGWLVVGLLGLAPAFVARSSSAMLAVGVGGVVLAFQALKGFGAMISHLVGASVAAQQVGPFFHSASRSLLCGSAVAGTAGTRDGAADNNVALNANNIVFRYPERDEPALRGCTLRLMAGDHALVEGPSGGGKSTLASVLYGLRVPQSGLLLIDGLDRQSLGDDEWSRRIAAAPQFHENYILTGTLAYNLLMGRRWPPEADDLEEAQQICIELGLGGLLARMPAGIQQLVGDGGWVLSHGERSRIYIARALLQCRNLVVLDESFAALDPENLRGAVACVRQRSDSLLVIVHP